MSIEWTGMTAHLRGEIDLTNVDRMVGEITQAGPSIVDLDGVTFIDSSGIRALIRLRRDHKSHIVNAPSEVARTLEMLGLAAEVLSDSSD